VSRGASARDHRRAEACDLTPEAVELVARRVVALLDAREVGRGTGAEEQPAGEGDRRLLDPVALAAQLGLTRAWVYEHAEELGVIRVGNGPRARLRFDLERAMAYCRGAEVVAEAQGTEVARPQPRRRPQRLEPQQWPAAGSLLKVRSVTGVRYASPRLSVRRGGCRPVAVRL
jgi:hypothetical protein